MSPTSYKTTKSCKRKAYLDHLNTKGNIHFDYGHAFGHAASQIFMRLNEPKEVRLGAAYVAMFAYSKNFENLQEHYSNKVLPKLVEGLRSIDMISQMLKLEYEYVDSEVKVILKVSAPDGVVYTLTGTYDLRMKNKITGDYVIFDFKAVAGDYLYSWETDPQIPIYTTLNQVVSDKYNLGHRYAPLGKYLVHYTKSADVFSTRSIDPSFWKYNSVGVFRDFMKEGKEETIAAGNHQDIHDLLVTRGVNPYECNKNNYRCSYYEQCYQHKYEVEAGFDDRRPSRVIVCDVTEADLVVCINKIADRTKLTAVEDTDNIMGSDDLNIDLDSISELDLETEATMDILLDL